MPCYCVVTLVNLKCISARRATTGRLTLRCFMTKEQLRQTHDFLDQHEWHLGEGGPMCIPTTIQVLCSFRRRSWSMTTTLTQSKLKDIHDYFGNKCNYRLASPAEINVLLDSPMVWGTWKALWNLKQEGHVVYVCKCGRWRSFK